MKKLLYPFLFAVSAMIILQSCGAATPEEENKTVAYLPLVKLGEAVVGPFEHKIKVQGSVETDQDVLLNAEMGGQIIKIYVNEGQKVRAGQILVSLDASIVASNMGEIQTQLEYAQYMLQKQEELKRRGVGSEFDYETAKNQVNSLKSRMRSLNAQRGKSSITAPFSGIVDNIFAKDGQVVGPQNPLVRLVNNEKVEITASLSEKHLSSVHEGTEVVVSFPNYKDTTIKVKVTNVGNYIEPTNRTFRISATVPKNTILLPNMLAELSIRDMFIEKALTIPAKAIIKDQDNRDFVYLAEKKKDGNYSVKKVYVEVLEKYKGVALVEDKGGVIKDNSLIVTSGAQGITEKDIVRTR